MLSAIPRSRAIWACDFLLDCTSCTASTSNSLVNVRCSFCMILSLPVSGPLLQVYLPHFSGSRPPLCYQWCCTTTTSVNAPRWRTPTCSTPPFLSEFKPNGRDKSGVHRVFQQPWYLLVRSLSTADATHHLVAHPVGDSLIMLIHTKRLRNIIQVACNIVQFIRGKALVHRGVNTSMVYAIRAFPW